MLIKRAMQSLIFRTTGRILVRPKSYDIGGKTVRSGIEQVSDAQQGDARPYGFLGDYPSFEAAAADCAGYDTQDISAAVAGRRRASIEAAKRNTDERFVDVIAAFGIAIAQLETDKVSVLDIGGGNGSFCDIISHFFPAISITWKVVETESMANACRAESPHISWSSTIPSGEYFDVALISGALQYLPQPYDTLRECGSISQWIILQRTPVGEREWISRQVVPPEIFEGSFAHRSFARQELLNVLQEIGAIEMSWHVEKDREDYISLGAASNGYLIRSGRSVSSHANR
jgi:putative methyltransferase (TIGR04325 family)